MSDAILHEKELRLEDAIRKLAWFEEEYRELQLSPVVKDYLYLSGKFEWELTPEERSRLKTVENTTEAKQFRRNEGNRILSGRDEIAAREDLVEYKTSNKISLVPLQFNMRDYYPLNAISTTVDSNAWSSAEEVEIDSLQRGRPTAELKQRKRAENDSGSPNRCRDTNIEVDCTCIHPE